MNFQYIISIFGRFIIIYILLFKKTEDGRYKGTFPDLEGCFGGDSLGANIESANAAAFDWISGRALKKLELPPIAHPEMIWNWR